jgi:hypothetical protein
MTVIEGQQLCPMCADELILHWVQTHGFGLKLAADFEEVPPKKHGHDSRQYG